MRVWHIHARKYWEYYKKVQDGRYYFALASCGVQGTSEESGIVALITAIFKESDGRRKGNLVKAWNSDLKNR